MVICLYCFVNIWTSSVRLNIGIIRVIPYGHLALFHTPMCFARYSDTVTKRPFMTLKWQNLGTHLKPSTLQ